MNATTITERINAVLKAGTETGLGFAERTLVEELFRADGKNTAAHSWHRSTYFLLEENVMEPAAVLSFSRALASGALADPAPPTPPRTRTISSSTAASPVPGRAVHASIVGGSTPAGRVPVLAGGPGGSATHAAVPRMPIDAIFRGMVARGVQNGLSKTEVISRLVSNFPDLHREWKQAGGGQL